MRRMERLGKEIIEYEPEICGIFNLFRCSIGRGAERKPGGKLVWMLFYELYRNQAAFRSEAPAMNTLLSEPGWIKRSK